MSLQTLLTDFPNYSARKVRRLANQIAFVEEAGRIGMADPPVAKGITSDLMEFNLLQAKIESQLNDDVRRLSPEVTESVTLTTVEAARRALHEMLEWMRLNTDANLKSQELNELVAKCNGIVYQASFEADQRDIP